MNKRPRYIPSHSYYYIRLLKTSEEPIELLNFENCDDDKVRVAVLLLNSTRMLTITRSLFLALCMCGKLVINETFIDV